MNAQMLMAGMMNLLADTVVSNGMDYTAWIAIRITLIVLIALSALFLIFVVLMQPTNTQGLGSISGESDTFFEKNKGKTAMGRLKKLTIIAVCAIVVFCILFFVMGIFKPGA